MLIGLSERLWRAVEKGMSTIKSQYFDMDLLNEMLGDIVLMLPGSFVTLNSHWEDWNLPVWYKSLSRTEQNAPTTNSNATLASGNRINRRQTIDASALNQAGVPAPRSASNSSIYQSLVRLHGAAHIIHFSGLGKPWTFPVRTVQNCRADAHPLFATQFWVWRETAVGVRPEGIVNGV